MKLLIVQFSPAPYHFISLRYKYSPQHLVLKHPKWSLNTRDDAYKTVALDCTLNRGVREVAALSRRFR
jgi:hypothetical protein